MSFVGGEKKAQSEEQEYRLIEVTVKVAVPVESPLLKTPGTLAHMSDEEALGCQMARPVLDGLGKVGQVRDVVAADTGKVISLVELRAVAKALRELGEAKLDSGWALGDVQRRVQMFAGLAEAEVEERGIWHEAMTDDEYESSRDPWMVLPEQCRCK